MLGHYLYLSLSIYVSRLSAALSSATQHAMPPEFGRKWGTEYLNTRFPLTTLCTPVCGIQREAKQTNKHYLYLVFTTNIFSYTLYLVNSRVESGNLETECPFHTFAEFSEALRIEWCNTALFLLPE